MLCADSGKDSRFRPRRGPATTPPDGPCGGVRPASVQFRFNDIIMGPGLEVPLAGVHVDGSPDLHRAAIEALKKVNHFAWPSASRSIRA